MYITARWMLNGSAVTGLSATVTVMRVSDGTKVVNGSAMTEISDGWYKYDASGLSMSYEYVGWCDSGSGTLVDPGTRYQDWNSASFLELYAIKAKTDLIPASPAAVGSAMTLQDDAITSAKFDESTAFPVKSADTGITQIARVGADGDTLETLSDQLDSKPSAASIADAVWDEAIAGHLGVGTAGNLLNGAGSAGDPWITELPGAYGAGTAGNIVGGLGLTGPSELVVTVVDDSENTIQGVLIALYSSSDQLLTTALTNVSGQVTFMVENSNYYFRCYKIGYGFTYPITVTVSGDTEKEITASVVTIVSPTPASVCRVYEYLLDLSGINPLATTAVEGLATAYVLPTDLGDALIEGVPVEGTYNSTTGLIYWDIAQGAIVSFRIPVVGLSKTVEIPESGSARLYDIEAI